jgi:arsenate reductase
LSNRPFNVLFLCTGNSARSIIAESLLNHYGRGRFVAYSAGSRPKGAVHPLALELLSHMGVPTAGLRSKSWEEFARPGSPKMDFVFTVCDNAAREPCPAWPAQPMTAHWGIDDPAAVKDSDERQRAAFRTTLNELESRIKTLTSLPMQSLDRNRLQERLDAIGRSRLSDARG